MSTDDENPDSLVDNLFREVDDHFADLERQYASARAELASADPDLRSAESSTDRGPDELRSSAERFELVSEAATLRSDLARTQEALAERDELLGELSERIGGFEKQIRAGEEAIRNERQGRTELAAERREVSRLKALLEARLAERQELTDLAHRLQSEKEHLEELLATALSKFEQVDAVRAEVTNKLSALETARATESSEFSARAMQLTDLRSDHRRLTELVADLTHARDEEERRATRFEGLIERRANEISYLNRRIESMSEDAARAKDLDGEIIELRRDNVLLRRRVAELEGSVESHAAKAVATARAVETLAERSSERDEFAAKVEELERELDRQQTSEASPIAAAAMVGETSAELRRLTERIKSLEATGTTGAAPLAVNVAGHDHHLDLPASEDASSEVADDSVSPLVDDAPSAEGPTEDLPAAAMPVATSAKQLPPPPPIQIPGGFDESMRSPFDAPTAQNPAPVEIDKPRTVAAFSFDESVTPTSPPPAAPNTAAPNSAAPTTVARTTTAAAIAGATSEPVWADSAPDHAAAVFAGQRRRTPLPAQIDPNTPEAIEFLLGQRGVGAIVDARSSCATTGMRPSELFHRLGQIRDRFDVPIEVVVTPVSTPVGGVPEQVAIGVHQVTGADTVADRVRALCIGFPADQPLVVIAGDDLVRRAAIAEDANVAEPTAVLGMTTR